jgi:transcriptional regulator with XRE-family HTH domain
MTAPGPATSGIADLDRTLGGLFWGDNVVWEIRRHASVEPFVRALVAAGGQAEAFAHVALGTGETMVSGDGIDVIDASADGPNSRPGELLSAVRSYAGRAERTILVFDALDAMAERWGPEIARRFFARCCPMLLEIGAIAYWSIGSADSLAALRREVEEITQCVLVVDDHRVRIAKADGRPPGVEGSVLTVSRHEDELRLTATPAAARLAVALRSLRQRRGLSQTDLAAMAGVSPSAISHAERGQSGLSLDTLLDLSGRLNVTLDELLRGDVVRGYQLARRHDPSERSASTLLPLLDELGVGLRVYLARLPPRASGRPDERHKGVEAVTVASGLVQIELGDRRAALRAGEALVAEASSITGWRNVGESEAMLFWILRDPRSAESA